MFFVSFPGTLNFAEYFICFKPVAHDAFFVLDLLFDGVRGAVPASLLES